MDEDEIFEPDLEDRFTLSLTRNEALYLDDTTTLMIEHGGRDERGDRQLSPPLGMRPVVFSAGIMAPYELIEKIGYAVLYTTDPMNEGQEVEMQFCMADLLMMREISQSFVKIGDEPVGYNLKRKIAKALYTELYSLKETDRIASRLLQGLQIE